MGGQNHQPTSSIRLLGPSAWLSQKLGEGFSAVLQSNNELENAIIAAADRLHVEELAKDITQTPVVYLERAISALEVSLTAIDHIQQGYGHLLDAADDEGYKGNPLASTILDLRLADQFSGTLILPTVNKDAWNAVESRVADTNVLATLKWESSQFDLLREPTIDLIAAMREAATALQDGGKRPFLEAVEWNEIPLRQRYAKAFSLWNHLHAMFLYSALMMTELFYRTNSFPSLLEEKQNTTTQHVA
jgi:hypothetical protein